MHLDLGKRIHKCNLKMNMSKIQGHSGVKDVGRGIQYLFELGYTVDLLDIVFVLYCHCYM